MAREWQEWEDEDDLPIVRDVDSHDGVSFSARSSGPLNIKHDPNDDGGHHRGYVDPMGAIVGSDIYLGD